MYLLNPEVSVFAGRVLKDNQLLYPSEEVVRFLSYCNENVLDNKVKQALDIGFGSGRHLKLLMDYGYRASGVELLKEALDSVKARFYDFKLLGELCCSSFLNFSFLECFFDCIIVWGIMMYQGGFKKNKQFLEHLYSVTSKGGRVCLNFRTIDNWFYGKGKEVEEGYYFLDERAGPYKDSYQAFFDEKSTKQVVESSGFKIINFERIDWWKSSMQERHSWWVVWGEKCK